MSEFRIIGYDDKGAAMYSKDDLEEPVDLSDINQERKASIVMKFKHAYKQTKAGSV